MIKNKILVSAIISGMIVMQIPIVAFAQTMPQMDMPTTETTPPPPEPVMETVTPADTTPPVISGVMQASIAPTHATIVWSTDEMATSTLRYGTTESYGTNAMLDPGAALMHTTTLTGLTASTKYFYCIDAADTAGNTAESCGHSFTTAAEEIPMDINPPTITSVIVDPISETEATISWTTDEVANGYVEYGKTASLGNQTLLNTDLSTDHRAIISGLTSGTEYYYKVVSSDESGNVAESTLNNFTTSTPPPPPEEPASEPASQENTTTPALTEPTPVTDANITNVEVQSITETSATITWTTDINSDSQVEYGDSEALGTNTPLDTALKTSHSVTIANLNPNMNYLFKVMSSASGQAAATISALHEFNTLAEPIFTTTPAHVSNVASSNLSDEGAAIAWTTSIPATSAVEYGTSTAYGQTVSNAGFNTSHSISLSSLSAGTVYYYRVKSVNETGDITYSKGYTFTTTGISSVSGNTATTVPSSQEKNQATSAVSSRSAGAPLVPRPAIKPTLVDAYALDSQISLTWNNSNDPSFDRTIVVRNGGSYPSSFNNGEKVYDGTDETFTDTNLKNGQKYYYGIFSYTAEGLHSVPVHVSLAPEANVEEVQINENPVIEPILPVMHFTQELKRGDTDIEVEHLQEILAATESSYPPKLIDGKFGALTEQGLKSFQEIHNLPQSGITDATTREKLHTVSMSTVTLQVPENLVLFSDTLYESKESQNVEALQNFLREYGSYNKEVDGKFGPLTKDAVIIFQKENNLTVDGIVGPQTRHKMRAVSGF